MNIKNILLTSLISGCLFAACSDDEIESFQFPITGTWQLVTTTINITLQPDATSTEEELIDIIDDYSLFATNSQTTFMTDSVTLVPELEGLEQPSVTLAYVISNQTLILTPLHAESWPQELQGAISVENTTMEFSPFPDSYMDFLRFIAQTYPNLTAVLDQISSIQVDFNFNRLF